MASGKETIALAGSGNIAQYLAEEFTKDGTYNLIIISRTRRAFFDKLPNITFHDTKDYSKDTVLPILNSSNATALISTLQGSDPVWYNTAHESLLHACRESQTCERLVSSEYMGNLRDLPTLPRGNHYARQPFRNLLTQQKQSDIKWTLVNQGWLADYFVQPSDGSKSYMRPFPEGWPIDMDRKTVRVTGTGDEPVGWTAARDMAKAVVKLMSFQDWPDHTYIFGELGTWNEAIEKVERFFGHKLERINRTKAQMDQDLLQSTDRAKWYTATMDEWSVLGGTAVPRQEALDQREKYFPDVHFRTIEEILSDSKVMEII